MRAATGGADVGWGFQMQEPLFVLGLLIVMVVVALSLFGVFEIGTGLTNVGGDLANKEGYSGSFWSGALAVLMATPCTAPLMAPALAFALAQPPLIMFLIFSCLGLGLASPYFIFAAFPKLLDVIPPPGGWMETFKQVMGFPMLAVAIWLASVLAKQLNSEGFQLALGAALVFAIAAWLLGRYGGFDKSAGTRKKAKLAAVAVAVAGLVIGYFSTQQRPSAEANIDFVAAIEKNRKEGKAVFVDFTATWCITCQVNKRTTLKTEKVQQAFAKNDIAFVTADWTNEDPRITAILKEHNQVGVPFYLLYPADPAGEPIELNAGPITTGDVFKAIETLQTR